MRGNSRLRIRTAGRPESSAGTVGGRRCRRLRLGSRSRLLIAPLLITSALLIAPALLVTALLRTVGRGRSAVRRSRIVAATTQQVHRIGQNLRRIAFVVVLIHPLAGAQAPFDIDLRTLADKAVHNVGQTPPQRDRMPLGVFLRFVGLTVEQPFGRRQADAGDPSRRLRACALRGLCPHCQSV